MKRSCKSAHHCVHMAWCHVISTAYAAHVYILRYVSTCIRPAAHLLTHWIGQNAALLCSSIA